MKVTTDQNEWEVQDAFSFGGPVSGDIVINSTGEARIEVTDNEIRLIADKVVIDCPRNKPIKINDKEEDDAEDEDTDDEDQAEHGAETAQAEEADREEAGAAKAVSVTAEQTPGRKAPLQTKDFLKNCSPTIYESIVRTRERMNQDPLDAEPSSKVQAKDGESIAGAIGVLCKYADMLEEKEVKKIEEKAKPHAATECIRTTLPGQKRDPNAYRDLKHYSDKSVGTFWRAGADDNPLKMWDYSWRRKQLDQLNKAVEKYANDVSKFDGDVLKRQAYMEKVKKHIQHGKQGKIFPAGITETEIQCNTAMDWSKWKSKTQKAAEAAKVTKEHKVAEAAKTVTEPVNGKPHPKGEEKGNPPIKPPLRTTEQYPFLRKAFSIGANVLREVATKLEEL